MNHIFLAGEHLLVAYTELPDYPLTGIMGDTAMVDVTNWPADIMRINETQCMVFADPNFMTAMGTGFTTNGTLINGALVWRDHFLYRHLETGELKQIADIPAPWHNLSREWYVTNYTGELYDELTKIMNRADNVNDTKQYQDELSAKMLRALIKYGLPAQYVYSVNVRTNGMSRINRNRLNDFS